MIEMIKINIIQQANKPTGTAKRYAWLKALTLIIKSDQIKSQVCLPCGMVHATI